jgi:hypothetical protein
VSLLTSFEESNIFWTALIEAIKLHQYTLIHIAVSKSVASQDKTSFNASLNLCLSGYLVFQQLGPIIENNPNGHDKPIY